MKPTLQQLFYGDLCPRQDASQTPPDCPTPYDEIKTSLERFRDRLNDRAPELLSKFDVLKDEIQSAFVSETEEMFHYGFGLAVKLLAEGLSCP